MDSKAELEKWVSAGDQDIQLTMQSPSHYKNDVVDSFWWAWQACQALNDKRIAGGWISVETRLPDYEQVKQRRVRVIVYWPQTNGVFTLWYGHRFGYNSPSFYEEYEWTESDLGFIEEDDNPFLGETLTYSTITHWMPLPNMPESLKDENQRTVSFRPKRKNKKFISY